MKKKTGLLAALALVMVVVLTACSSGMTAKDAKEYAQSCLDASYKAEFDTYMKWTDSTKEEAQAMYEQRIVNAMEVSGFVEAGITQELQDAYEQLFIDIYGQAKYSLADAVDDGADGYTIDVTIHPFTVFVGIEDEFMVELEEKFAGITTMPTDEDVNEMVFQVMYDLLKVRVENMVYGEPQVVTIHVLPDSDGVYYVQEEDFYAIEEAMVPFE